MAKSPHCSVPSGFPAKILYEISVYSDRAMAQAVDRLASHQVPFQSRWNLSTKWQKNRFYTNYFSFSGPGSVVGIAIGYGLDGPGTEFRWGDETFRTCPDRPWGQPSLLYSGYRVFPGGKERPGRDAGPSPPPSAVVKKEYSYTSTPPMGHTACTEPQCMNKGALFFISLQFYSYQYHPTHAPYLHHSSTYHAT